MTQPPTKLVARRIRDLAAALSIGAATLVAPAAAAASTTPPIVWGSVQIERADTQTGSSIAAADFDGDGDVDLATAGSGIDVGTGYVGWYENDGSGHFGSGTEVSTTSFGADRVIAADLDGDGDPDLVTINELSDTVAWFENDGDGNFGSDALVDDGVNSVSFVDSSDLDGDGDLDLVITSFSNDTVSWYRNDGTGNFGNGIIVGNDVGGATSAIAADLDGDGDLDLAATGFSDDAAEWFENDGSGNFDPNANAVAATTEPLTIIDADFDGDNDVDLAVVTASDGVAWYRNDGSGNYESAGTVSTIADRRTSVVAADLDDDGDIDLAATVYGVDTVAWFENSGTGDFEAITVIDDIARRATAIAAADLDDDGDVDLASIGAHLTSYENTPEPPRELNALTPLEPARFLDTRELGTTHDGLFAAGGRRSAESELRVRFGERGTVPAGASAVIANVTAVQAAGIGFVTAHPCEVSRPLASSLNFTEGVNVANEIVLSLDDAGDACLYTSQSTHLLVDVVGYLVSDSPVIALEPSRYFDSRPGGSTFDNGGDEGVRSAGTTATVNIAPRGGVPNGAASAIVNVTAVRPEADGYLSAHPCLPQAPNAASLNFATGVTRANELIVDLDADGNFCVFTSASTHLLVDVVGYVLPGDDIVSLAPSRLLDTRPGASTIDGENEATGYRSRDTRLRLQVAGRPGVPGDAAGAALYVTAVQPDVAGFVTVGPCSPGRPEVSSLNHDEQGPNVGNELMVQLDADGGVCIFTSSATHLTVDVVAYFD